MGDPRYKIQRRYPRYQVRDVRGRFPLRIEVEVLNMSLTGLAVECRRPLEIGREYEFTLQEGAESVELEARCRASGRSVAGAVFPTG